MEEDRYTRITLRLPKELDEALDAEAARTSKSKNAEIVSRLERSFSEAPAINGMGMRAIFEKLEQLEAAVKSGSFVPFSQTPAGKALKAKRAKAAEHADVQNDLSDDESK